MYHGWLVGWLFLRVAITRQDVAAAGGADIAGAVEDAKRLSQKNTRQSAV
jgi:hypothetical protein